MICCYLKSDDVKSDGIIFRLFIASSIMANATEFKDKDALCMQLAYVAGVIQ